MINIKLEKKIDNTDKILRKHNKNMDTVLKSWRDIGDSNIDGETPVISGNLKRGNSSKIEDDGVVWWNDVSYFIFVHNGTTFQSANPYMMRGITKSLPLIGNILTTTLRNNI